MDKKELKAMEENNKRNADYIDEHYDEFYNKFKNILDESEIEDENKKIDMLINPNAIVDNSMRIIKDYLDKQGIKEQGIKDYFDKQGMKELEKLTMQQKKELIKIMEEYMDNNLVEYRFIGILIYLKKVILYGK